MQVPEGKVFGYLYAPPDGRSGIHKRNLKLVNLVELFSHGDFQPELFDQEAGPRSRLNDHIIFL
jgi:hypothetical protein